MANPFSSARHQAAISQPTAYRRWSQFTFTRGGVTQILEPVSGSLTQDDRRNGRWDGTLTFAGDSLMPRKPGDILTPFGTRVSAQLGLELLDGSVSAVPYGTYEITGARTNETPDGRTTQITLTDVSNVVERYRFESSFTVEAGNDLADMINDVVTDRTGVNPLVLGTGSSLGADRVFGLDTSTAPWSELLSVLSGFSRIAWYDRTGRILIGTGVVDPGTAYPLDEQTSFSADFDTMPPNVVVARGESTDDTPPVQAVSMDDDPSSPTYAGTGPGTSPYGRVTYFFSSPLLTDEPSAQSAADTILAQNLGAGATQTMTRPYDPTITCGDAVTSAGSVFAVDAVTVDLTGETTLQVREL